MATSKDLKNQLTEQNNQAVDPSELGLKALMNTPTMKNKFKEVLKEKSDGFMASVLNLVNNDSYLSSVDPMSIVTSAMVAASLDLPVSHNEYLFSMVQKLNNDLNPLLLLKLYLYSNQLKSTH